MPSTPGDGKTSPFGNGAGGTEGPKAMPVDFTRSPGGSRNGSPAPQSTYESNPDISAKDAAPGGRILKADATPSPAKDLGVGTVGNSARPFTLDGGQ